MSTQTMAEIADAHRRRRGRPRQNPRELIAVPLTLVGIVLFTISINTSWFVLDSDEPRSATAMRPLVGSGDVGSSVFVFYLVAVPVLLALVGATAARGARGRAALRSSALSVAAAIAAVLLVLLLGGPVLGSQAYGDVVPIRVTHNLYFALGAVAAAVLAVSILPVPQREKAPQQRPIILLVAAIGAYGSSVRLPWLQGAGLFDFHVGTSLFGAAYLIIGLVLIGLAGAACASDARAISVCALILGGAWTAIQLLVLAAPQRFVFDPAVRLDVDPTAGPVAGAVAGPSHAQSGMYVALFAVLLAVAAVVVASPVPRLRWVGVRSAAWGASALCFLGALVWPWVFLATNRQGGSMGLLGGVAAYAGNGAVLQLIGMPILLALAGATLVNDALRWPATALAACLVAVDVAILLRPKRFVGSFDVPASSVAGSTRVGIYLGIGCAVLSVAAAWVGAARTERSGRPGARDLFARSVMLPLTCVFFVVLLLKSWAIGDIDGYGHFVGDAFSAPQGLAVLTVVITVIVGSVTTQFTRGLVPGASAAIVDIGVAFLAIAWLLSDRSALLLPDQYAVSVARYATAEHLLGGYASGVSGGLLIVGMASLYASRQIEPDDDEAYVTGITPVE